MPIVFWKIEAKILVLPGNLNSFPDLRLLFSINLASETINGAVNGVGISFTLLLAAERIRQL